VTTATLASLIDAAFERRADIAPGRIDADLARALDDVMAGLNAGTLRVAEKVDGTWATHQWIKKAVLLYFRTHDNQVMPGSTGPGFDKVPARFDGYGDGDFRAGGYRVVPGAVARAGAFIGKNVILMPSFVNIGAYVDGIGGVLEPLQANPTIIEDNCFIGARSEVVEGVIVEANSVLSMGVFISQSTKIYDRTTGEIIYGRVPAGSVVVPGSLPSADGRYSLSCAVIVKRVDAQTRSKTSINDLLRD